MKEKNVEKIVLPTICLHNFLMMREDREVERKIYCPTTYIDDENDDGSVLQECGVMQLQRIQVSTILVV